MTAFVILAWMRDFKTHNYGMFSEDRRGKHLRAEFLSSSGLDKAFRSFIVNSGRTITVDLCQKYLQKALVERNLLESLPKFGLTPSLSRRTVHK